MEYAKAVIEDKSPGPHSGKSAFKTEIKKEWGCIMK